MKITDSLGRTFIRHPWAKTALRRMAKLVWWTVTLQLPRRLGDRSRLLRTSLSSQRLATTTEQYQQWIERFDYSPANRKRYYRQLNRLTLKPTISVLMPCYKTPAGYLEEAIRSVTQQVYSNWELCIAADVSSSEHVRQILKDLCQDDSRVKVVYCNSGGSISEATNSAFELATGDFATLLNPTDLLREHALAEIAIAVNDRRDVQLIYTDEDTIDAGQRFEPLFKPDWSPDLFQSQNYLSHLTVYRTDSIRRVGGWRRNFEGAQNYDLNLRIIEKLDQRAIVHIPKILYHCRAVPTSINTTAAETDDAYGAGKRALEEIVARTKHAKVEDAPGLVGYRVVYPVPEPHPLVSLIIPTKDKVELLQVCISSILSKTTYQNFEIFVVDNNSNESASHEYFRDIQRNSRVQILHYSHSFNYSAINNFAASRAKGSIIGLINNDIEVMTPDWLREMVSHACRPEVGCVGAKLYYPDDTVQHAGVIIGLAGVAGHAHKHFPRNHPGYAGRLHLCQNVSAVTAACLLVRREVYESVGGLDETHLKIAFNDVDFCLKVRQAGYLNVFTPFAELYHHESISRGHENTPDRIHRFRNEIEIIKRRWRTEKFTDPYYSPNLTRDREDFGLRTR